MVFSLTCVNLHHQRVPDDGVGRSVHAHVAAIAASGKLDARILMKDGSNTIGAAGRAAGDLVGKLRFEPKQVIAELEGDKGRHGPGLGLVAGQLEATTEGAVDLGGYQAGKWSVPVQLKKLIGRVFTLESGGIVYISTVGIPYHQHEKDRGDDDDQAARPVRPRHGAIHAFSLVRVKIGRIL
jgi:hypothetical protein